MKFHQPTIIANIVIASLLILLGLMFGAAGVGAAFVLTGAIDILLIIGYLIAGNKPGLKTAALLAGFCLLVGFTLCSSFALNIH